MVSVRRMHWSVVVALIALPGLAACAGQRAIPVPAQVVDQHFYSFAPGFRCKTFSPDPAGIPSWTDHLEVKADMVLQWGSRCQDSAVPLAAGKARGIVFEADGQALVLGGVRYVRVADPAAQAESLAK